MKRSPFPGMDPFLEDPAEWSGVHADLITSIRTQLAAEVIPNYRVKIEQRVYLVQPGEESKRRAIVPDVYIVERPTSEGAALSVAGGIAPATMIEPLFDLEIRERYIEIRDNRNQEIVTIIELLSPANKSAVGPGYEAFRQKRKQVLASQTHWIEIDLLHAGERLPAVAGESDYYALLKRVGEYRYAVWYFDLRDRMPTIAVPLRPPDEDVALDLQAAFEDAYARGYYGESIDYDPERVPLPRLRAADAAWIKARIEAWKTTEEEINGEERTLP
jgi:hypothetical protein